MVDLEIVNLVVERPVRRFMVGLPKGQFVVGFSSIFSQLTPVSINPFRVVHVHKASRESWPATRKQNPPLTPDRMGQVDIWTFEA